MLNEESGAMEPIDFRSDTVTLPSPEMREAMAAAALGDDVYGEDPTVKALEARAAELLGKEAALYVPTGTMGNLLAVMTHCQPGDELICGKRTHTYASEGGGPARLCGVSVWTVAQDRGRLDPAEVAAGIHPDNEHLPRTSLLIVEQPHGGWVMPMDNFKAVISIAREHGLKVHMDGARVFNAATALGVPASELASQVDTVMFCVSKGLAAPVGSMLVGSAEFIKRAHRNRKAVGGGMRQAGVIAAGGLYALNNLIGRLAEDHANAKRLAAGLRKIGWTVDREDVETNIFMVESPAGLEGREAAAGLKERGVLVSSPYVGRRMRLVTHYGIEEADIDRALEAFAAVTEGALVRG
jgi:threonine aldolase